MARQVAGLKLKAGTYLTNGRSLVYVLSVESYGVEAEDCLHFSLDDLGDRVYDLRTMKPERAASWWQVKPSAE